MKKLLLTLILAGFSLGLMAQGSQLKFRSLDGEKFWLVINDLRKNFNPEPAVTITDFPKNEAEVSIVFERASLGQLKTTLHLHPNTEVSYVIHPRNFRSASATEVILTAEGETLLAVESVKVLEETMVRNDDNSATELPPVEDAPAENPTDVATTKTNTLVDDREEPLTTEIVPDVVKDELDTETPMETVVKEEIPVEPEIIHFIDGYTGPYGCDQPMSNEEYKDARNNIKSRPYASSKMSTAKQVVRTSNCVSVDQIKGIIGLFSFESDRLEFAKFAYPYTYDQGNYGKIDETFTFGSSVSDLKEYIQTLK